MKKIIIITFLMSVFMLSYSFAQAEYDWDEQGVQSLSFFESIINSLTTGSTIPSGCDYLSYQQKVFDADDKIHLDAVGNSCKEGDYIKMFSCGLDTQYSSVSQCNYGGSIREGSYKIEDIDLNPSYRYMYFCYDCEAGETSPKTVCENSGLSFGGVFDKSICVGDKSGAYSCQNGGFYCYSGSNNYYYCNLDYALNFVPCKSGEECINGLCKGEEVIEVYCATSNCDKVFKSNCDYQDSYSTSTQCVTALNELIIGDLLYKVSSDKCILSSNGGYSTQAECEDNILYWCLTEDKGACYKMKGTGNCKTNEVKSYSQESCEAGLSGGVMDVCRSSGGECFYKQPNDPENWIEHTELGCSRALGIIERFCFISKSTPRTTPGTTPPVVDACVSKNSIFYSDGYATIEKTSLIVNKESQEGNLISPNFIDEYVSGFSLKYHESGVNPCCEGFEPDFVKENIFESTKSVSPGLLTYLVKFGIGIPSPSAKVTYSTYKCVLGYDSTSGSDSFCPSFVVSIGKALGGKDNSCTVGWFASVIAGLVIAFGIKKLME